MNLINFIIIKNIFGDYKEVELQKNKKTDLFERSIENFADFKRKLDNDKKEGIDSLKNIDHLKNDSDIDSKIRELESIGDNELSARGREELLRGEHVLIHADYKESELDDAKKIANAQEGLLDNLLDKLRENLGINCKTIEGDERREPEYYLQINKEKINKESDKKLDRDRMPKGVKEDEEIDTIYNQVLCEELRNKYDCSKYLEVRCSDPEFIAGRLGKVTGNMTHYINRSGDLVIGVNQTAYFYDGNGCQQDFIFNFEVDNPAGILTFKLLDIDWSDYVLVKLNENIIFQGNVRGKLEMLRHERRRGRDGDMYYAVDIGVGYLVPANTKRYYGERPYFEAKQYLKQGENKLHIRLVYGNGGKLWTRLNYREKKCNSWEEKWVERCVIK